MALRPESSVSIVFDEWGVMGFQGDAPSPVVHRTPEELGIPRTVRDVAPPPRLSVKPDFIYPDECRRQGIRGREGLKKDAPVKAAGVGLNARTTERKKQMENEARTVGGAWMAAR
jgi:hypothetical protein